MFRLNLFPILLASLALSGCELFEGRGQVSLSIAATDPVEQFDGVIVAVSKVVFVSEEDGRETIDITPAEQIDLLEFTRGDGSPLITDETIQSGRYESVEITIESDESSSLSFIQDGSNEFALFIPDDQQAKLELPADFEIEDGETTVLTLQLELRESLRERDDGVFELHPSVRLVQDDEVGTVKGTIATALVPEGCAAAVYAYKGSNIIPVDIDDTGGPISTAAVFGNRSDGLSYSVDFLEAGPYTLAFTCDADEEDPVRSDDLAFVTEDDVTVEAGETKTLNIAR